MVLGLGGSPPKEEPGRELPGCKTEAARLPVALLEATQNHFTRLACLRVSCQGQPTSREGDLIPLLGGKQGTQIVKEHFEWETVFCSL
jgi:hypothetical protein